MRLNELKDKRVLILGFGREGRNSLKFLKKLFPEKVIGVADQKQFPISNFQFPKTKWHLGKNYLKALKNYDVIIKSPGIPPAKILRKFRRQSQIITSQTEIFFENCPGKIVGITGTKGKSTTASLIYKILKEGLRVHPVKSPVKLPSASFNRGAAKPQFNKVNLVGNIGKPVLNLLFSATPRDVYVYELSSHQLMNLKKSPQIAVFLNIYPEHGDYYQNFKEYLKAKQNICRYQTKNDYFIYNKENKNVRESAKITKAKKIPINPTNYEFKRITNKIRNRILLRGKFNLLNVAAAIEVGKIFKIPDEKIAKAIEKFKPLPHRLEFVGKYKGIEFYNDSLATIPEATIEAIGALGKNLKTIILGGYERGQDFKNLAKRILKSKIENLIFFPTTGQRIWQEIKKLDRERFSGKNCFFVNKMKEAVKLAYQKTKKGKICLLSPASASFNLFKDYKERGNLFKKWIKILGK